MPSDAFMEMSPWAVEGESGDKAWGEGTEYGMFEITSLQFNVGDTTSQMDDSDPETDGSHSRSQRGSGKRHGSGQSMAKHGETSGGEITIEKAIDQTSPVLFRHCVEKGQPGSQGNKKIAWAVVYLREAGESSGRPGETSIPWLRLEFRKLDVKSFTWDVDPAAAGEEAKKMEKITFRFETMLIQYYQQDVTGSHPRFKQGMWNWAKNNGSVTPIGPDDVVEYVDADADV